MNTGKTENNMHKRMHGQWLIAWLATCLRYINLIKDNKLQLTLANTIYYSLEFRLSYSLRFLKLEQDSL